MKLFVANSALVAVLCAAPLASAADRAGATVFPAPVHLMNLSPSFAAHPTDLTLLAPPSGQTRKANVGTLTPSPSSPPNATETSRLNVVKREDAANFHFDARLPASALEIRPSQTGTLYFTPASAWTVKKSN